MKKIKIGNEYFNTDFILKLDVVSKQDGTKHWIKVTHPQLVINQKGETVNQVSFVEFKSREEAEEVLKNS